jgi:hypothetical protein
MREIKEIHKRRKGKRLHVMDLRRNAEIAKGVEILKKVFENFFELFFKLKVKTEKSLKNAKIIL